MCDAFSEVLTVKLYFTSYRLFLAVDIYEPVKAVWWSICKFVSPTQGEVVVMSFGSNFEFTYFFPSACDICLHAQLLCYDVAKIVADSAQNTNFFPIPPS